MLRSCRLQGGWQGIAPGHRSRIHSGGPCGFDVADLIADADRLRGLRAKLSRDAPEFPVLAEHRGAAVEAGDQAGGGSEHLPDLAAWLPFYDGIRGVKIARGRDFPPDTLARTREFLDGFLASFERATRRAFRLRLVRHARTALNDGTFLGRRDPPVAESIAMEPLRDEFDTVYSSPLRRAVDTARALAPRAAIQVDQRLIEIDYGHAEGLTPDELRRRFPETAGAWDRGEDAAFPGGEGTTDVLRRARAFLGALAGSPGRALAVTHNVVLRAIAADLLGLDLRRAHRIPIAHLAPLDVCCIGGRWLPDWGTTVKAGLLDGFVGWPS